MQYQHKKLRSTSTCFTAPSTPLHSINQRERERESNMSSSSSKSTIASINNGCTSTSAEGRVLSLVEKEFLTAQNKIRGSTLKRTSQVLKSEEFTLNKLNLPIKGHCQADLCGRKEETESLMKWFRGRLDDNAVSSSSSPLLCIQGPAGVGKTVLAEQLRWEIRKHGGFFCRG